VRQDFSEIGRRSLLALLREIESGELTSSHVIVEPELVVRTSTAARQPRVDS
jgi:DNA-binding LacI/PurR family transcriptional regulator